MSNETLIFDTPYRAVFLSGLKKSQVKKEFIKKLNSMGLIPLNLVIESKFSLEHLDTIWILEAYCAKTTITEAKKIKELKRRPSKSIKIVY